MKLIAKSSLLLLALSILALTFIGLAKIFGALIGVLVYCFYSKILSLLCLMAIRFAIRQQTFSGAGWFNRRRVEYQIAK